MPVARRRLAFFSKSKRRTLYTHFIIRALERCGCDVLHVNMIAYRRFVGRRLADCVVSRHVEGFQPDALIVFSSDIQPRTFDALRRRFPTALLLDDCFELDAPVTERILKVDVFFHTMTGMLEEYRSLGVRRPVYLHSGVDPEAHRRVASDRRYASDVAFIGKAIYPARIELMKRLDAEFDFRAYGRGWDAHGLRGARPGIGVREFRRVCASAKVVVGIDKTDQRELYFSNRTWFVLGSGGFLLTRYVPGLERLFANHRHLAWFRSPDEAVSQITHYLQHDERRQLIADAGQAFVHEHYPFDRMARNMLKVLFESGEPDPLTDPGASLKCGERP